MKRGVRWMVRGVFGLGGLLLTAVIALVAPVDHTPYLRTDYFKTTSARMDRVVRETSAARGPVRAGFARVRLTPTLGVEADAPEVGRFRRVPLAGYGARQGRSAEGVAEDVWVKAMALEVGGRRMVWVAMDALIVPREVADAAVEVLSREVGLKRGEVYFGATHTHSSLGGWGEGWVAEAFAGGYQPGIRTWMTRCLVDATKGAVSNLAPASVASGSFHAAAGVRNRLVGELGRVDDVFSVLAVRQQSGGLAVLGSYGAHATVFGADNMRFHRDYPGAWASGVEEATGGMAMFMAGAVGSLSARTESGTPAERAERLGRSLAERTGELLGRLEFRKETEMAAVTVETLLPELNWRVHDSLRLRPWAARRLLPVHADTILQAVRVGHAMWISTPCDFSGELALGLREHAASLGRDLAVTSFNGDYIGYVIPGKYYHLGGYEPQTMSFFGPTVPDYFEELLRRATDAAGAVASGGR